MGSVHLGRIAYSYRALPAVQVASHVLDGGDIVARSHGHSPVVSPAYGAGVVVAYEADVIDPGTFCGWSVTVTGYAGLIRDPDEVIRWDRALPLWPAAGGSQLIRLHPSLVSGYRFAGPGGEPPVR